MSATDRFKEPSQIEIPKPDPDGEAEAADHANDCEVDRECWDKE